MRIKDRFYCDYCGRPCADGTFTMVYINGKGKRCNFCRPQCLNRGIAGLRELEKLNNDQNREHNDAD